MSDSEPDIDLALDGVFPEEPRPPSPESTFAIYERAAHEPPAPPFASALPDWKEIKIKLVGEHPLWGHHLWNAARSFATYLDARPALYAGKNVLELGAGGGLPGLVCALNGANKVVLTDYPDSALIDNISHNVRENVPAALAGRVDVQGYIWGRPAEPLLHALGVGTASSTGDGKFDLIILSDLIFNHSQHDALLDTCDRALSRPSPASAPAPDSGHAKVETPAPCLLVFYTHHRPRFAPRDMEFFAKARARGWACDEVVTERYPPMFPEDPGEEEVRATVHGWMLRR